MRYAALGIFVAVCLGPPGANAAQQSAQAAAAGQAGRAVAALVDGGPSAGVDATSHPLVVAYGAELDDLLMEDPASIATATQRWHAQFAGAPIELRDAAFRRFHAWHREAINGLFSRIQREAASNGADVAQFGAAETRATTDTQLEWLAQQASYFGVVTQPEYAGTGMTIDWAEGDAYPVVDALFYLTEFAALLGPELKLYLQLESEELHEPAARDAAIVIDMLTMSDRLAAWEDFALAYPDVPEAKEAAAQASWYLTWLVLGMPNTPLWDGEHGGPQTLNPDYRRAYEWHLLNYGDLPSAKVVRAFYEMLRARAWRMPAERELGEFYAQYDIQPD